MLRRFIHSWLVRIRFPGSANYWEARYAAGHGSGDGSYGPLAEYKARFLNDLVRQNGLRSVIEFGCGDGNQLSLAEYPSYIGVDVSRTAVDICRKRFGSDPTKSFCTIEEYAGQTADCALSLDVIYHLVEDRVFEDYMGRLFRAAEKTVVIYSSFHDQSYGPGAHVRHRDFRNWVALHAMDWKLRQHVENPMRPKAENDDRTRSSPADFFIFEKVASH